MWVLIVMLAGTVTMHDFDDRAACDHAAGLVLMVAKSQVSAFCAERQHSVFGPHDNIQTK